MSWGFQFRDGEMVSAERIDEPTPEEIKQHCKEGKKLRKEQEKKVREMRDKEATGLFQQEIQELADERSKGGLRNVIYPFKKHYC